MRLVVDGLQHEAVILLIFWFSQQIILQCVGLYFIVFFSKQNVLFSVQLHLLVLPDLEVVAARVHITQKCAFELDRSCICAWEIAGDQFHVPKIVTQLFVPVKGFKRFLKLFSDLFSLFLVLVLGLGVLVELRVDDVLAVVHHGFQHGRQLHCYSVLLVGYENCPALQSAFFHVSERPAWWIISTTKLLYKIAERSYLTNIYVDFQKLRQVNRQYLSDILQK